MFNRKTDEELDQIIRKAYELLVTTIPDFNPHQNTLVMEALSLAATELQGKKTREQVDSLFDMDLSSLVRLGDKIDNFVPGDKECNSEKPKKPNATTATKSTSSGKKSATTRKKGQRQKVSAKRVSKSKSSREES